MRHYFDLCLQEPTTIKQRYKSLQAAQWHNAKKLTTLKQRQAIVNDRLTHYRRILSGQVKDDLNPPNLGTATLLLNLLLNSEV